MKVLRSVKFDGGSVGHNFRPIRSLNGRRVLLRRSFSQQIIRKGDDEEREDDIVWYMRLMNKVSNLFRSVIWRRE
ncbi:hypothetical protein AB6A40_009331 [Gnathostoma spinigerum]|uniref:Uncharacterized protein n=1 Tax=Gnathostoma spinigerum TaxID=75299 RepID=A0ABD6F0G6_9BILA